MFNVFARSVYLCRLLSVDLYCFLLFGCLGTMVCFDEFSSHSWYLNPELRIASLKRDDINSVSIFIVALTFRHPSAI